MIILGVTQSAAESPPPEVTVAAPVVKDIIEEDEFVGRFEAFASVDVRARVSGYLQEILFTDGILVEQGDLLFKIEPRLFDASLLQAQAQVDVATATYDFASEQLERANSLVLNGSILQSVVDERRVVPRLTSSM